MKRGIKTVFIVILLLGCYRVSAQNNSLLPVSNKLLLNPSYAGLNKNTSVWSGTVLQSNGRTALDNEFHLTWDTYSESLKGGIALYFYEGLTGKKNTNTTGVGFSYSKPVSDKSKKSFIPSLNFNYRLATKNWFVQAMEPQNPLGREILRYHNYQPRVGLLWNSPSRQIGLSVAWNFYSQIASYGIPAPKNIAEVILQYSQSMRGKEKGLVSKPLKTTPEFVLHYTPNILFTRTGLKITQVNHNYAVFIQNSFRKNIHGAGGMVGWRFKNFRLNILAAPAYDFNTKNIVFRGEFALGLIVPYVHSNKKYPWKPVKKFF